MEERSLEVEERVDDEADLVEVTEDTDMKATSASFTSRVQTERWGLEETRRFYTALQQFGTDFTLMQSMFPTRNQRQLKNKFKKEEKAHHALVTLALQPKIARPLVNSHAANEGDVAAAARPALLLGAGDDGARGAPDQAVFDPKADEPEAIVSL